MKNVYYSKDAQFELTDEEFKAFVDQSNTNEHVWIQRLNVFLSGKYIWAGDKPENPDRVKLHDGGYAIRKFGSWYLENDPEIKIDLSYYPELRNPNNNLNSGGNEVINKPEDIKNLSEKFKM